MPQEEHRLLSSFLNSNMGKHQLKIVSIWVIPPQVTHMKTRRKFIKSSMTIALVPDENCEHSGRPSTGHTYENMEKVHKIINDD